MSIVKLKPLQWRQVADGEHYVAVSLWRCDYWVNQAGPDRWIVSFADYAREPWRAEATTKEAAMALCQAHHDTRALSLLDLPAPSTVAGEKARFEQYMADGRFAFKVDEVVARYFWNGGIWYGRKEHIMTEDTNYGHALYCGSGHPSHPYSMFHSCCLGFYSKNGHKTREQIEAEAAVIIEAELAIPTKRLEGLIARWEDSAMNDKHLQRSQA